jgi:hypothetical protein
MLEMPKEPHLAGVIRSVRMLTAVKNKQRYLLSPNMENWVVCQVDATELGQPMASREASLLLFFKVYKYGPLTEHG